MKKALSLTVLLLVLVFGGFSASAQSQLVVPVTIVNVSFLNLRSGPGPQYSIISQLVGGTTAPVLAANSDSSWLLVETPIGAGWVYSPFTLPRGDFRFVPVLEEAPASATIDLTTPLYIGLTPIAAQTPITSITLPVPQLQSPTLVVNTSFLNIRSGPGGYFGILAVATGGDTFTPLGITNDGSWFLIEGPFGRGWVDQDYVLFRGEINNVPIVFSY
jgi:uncharacterized protein YraI